VRHPEAVQDLPIPRAHDDLLPDSLIWRGWRALVS
jgi:hypothetical protein